MKGYDHEWSVLVRNLRSWADHKGKYAKDKLNDYHLHHRKQLRFFVLFIGSTGIRPGTETRGMKWEDITFANYVLIINKTKDELQYDRLSADDKRTVDTTRAARDQCVRAAR